MLSKAARRKNALRYLQQASEQIQLPWLCPALFKLPRTRIQSRSITHRPSASSIPKSILKSQSPRRSASAAASPDLLQADGYLEYHPPRDSQSSSSAPFGRILSEISPHDPSALIMIDNTVTEPPERISGNKFKEIQIRGNAHEIKTTMEACLQVHRFDRAIALLRQLQIVVHPKSQYLREAFNDCLHAMIIDLIVNKNKKNVELINQWLEVDMHNAGVEPDARTYALKVKAALATMTGSKRDRTVRRYWELARQSETLNEVASLRDILSEQDLGKLSEIVPQTQIGYEVEEYHDSNDHLEIVKEPALAQRPVEEIRETHQKGLGLTSLRKSLSLFQTIPTLRIKLKSLERIMLVHDSHV